MKGRFWLICLLLLCLVFWTGAASAAEKIQITGGHDLQTAGRIDNFGAIYVSSIDYENELDVFAFKTGDEDAYYTFRLENLTIDIKDWAFVTNIGNLFMVVVDEYSEKVVQIAVGGTQSVRLPAHHQYSIGIQVYNDKLTGNYQFSIDRRVDSAGDTRETAAPMTFGQEFRGSIDGVGDADYYEIPAQNNSFEISAQIRCVSLPAGNFVVNVSDVYGEVFDEQIIDVGTTAHVKVRAEANTKYYLAVWSNRNVDSGSYLIACCDGVSHTEDSSWQVDDVATCDREGMRSKRCLVCAIKTKTQVIPALGHVEGEWQTSRQAKCTEEGLSQKLCGRCSGVLAEENIPALGHMEGTWYTIRKPSCEAEGLDQKVCRRCSIVLEEKIVPPNGHTLQAEWTVDYEPTCEAAGRRIKKCTVCDKAIEEEEIAPLGHRQEPEWATASEATCTKQGEHIKRCERCGTVMSSEEIPAHGHEMGEWRLESEAQCAKPGLEARYCIVCGGAREEREIPALGHVEGTWYTTTRPTCEENGLSQHICGRCARVLEEQTIPALGHEPGAWTVTQAATKEREGEEMRLCERCDYFETRSVERIPKNLWDKFMDWFK